MNTHPSPVSGASTNSRRRLVLAGRVAAGLAVSAATFTMFGGSAFAGAGEPIVPLDPAFEPVFEPIEPIIPFTPIEIPEIPLDVPELTIPGDGPIITIPGDGPIITIPDDGPIITIPGGIIPGIPECADWNPADVAVSSVDNGDLTATVTLAYSGPDDVCDELFVVHSTQEDAAMNPLALLAEEHVTLAGLVADADHTIAVDVPLDPCYTRVFTHGPEALLMQDDHYGDGCPDPTTTTEPETTETTEPPVETVPPTVPPTVQTTLVGGSSGTLPQTGSSSTVIALLGAALVLTGGCLGIGVRKSQSAA